MSRSSCRLRTEKCEHFRNKVTKLKVEWSAEQQLHLLLPTCRFEYLFREILLWVQFGSHSQYRGPYFLIIIREMMNNMGFNDSCQGGLYLDDMFVSNLLFVSVSIQSIIKK